MRVCLMIVGKVYESTQELWVEREIALDIQHEGRRKLRARQIS